MLYKTKLGEIPVEKEDIVNFESGLPGFEQWRRYALISLPETEPIQWLISLDNSAITFPVLDPWLVKKEYAFDISQETIEFLDIRDREKILIVNIVRIPKDDPTELTINLLAPLVINLENRRGMQLILDRNDYSLRHAIRPELNKNRIP